MQFQMKRGKMLITGYKQPICECEFYESERFHDTKLVEKKDSSQTGQGVSLSNHKKQGKSMY